MEGGFNTRIVEPGRVVMTEQLVPFFDVGALFGAVGWDGILRISTPTRPALVRYFFANLQAFPEEQMGEGEVMHYTLTSRIRGVDIHITEELQAEVFGLSLEGDCIYWEPMGEMAVSEAELTEIRGRHLRAGFVRRVRMKHVVFRESDLRDLSRIVCRILQHNMLPQAHHRDEVSPFRLYVTDALVRGVRLSLPYIIIQTMIHAFHSRWVSTLPYLKLLTHLIERVF